MVQQKRGYVLIDGLRGIAALAVASLHWQVMSAPWLFAASGGLAVDLFFLLSGIVIAHAYDERIASGDLNTARFMLTRLIRFWPLYAIGTLLGAAAVCMALATGRSSYYHSYGEVAMSVALMLTAEYLEANVSMDEFVGLQSAFLDLSEESGLKRKGEASALTDTAPAGASSTTLPNSSTI